MTPQEAILLAPRLAEPMRALTGATPAPLLPLGGRPLIEHALDRLAAAGVRRVVINARINAPGQEERLARHLAARPGPPETVLRSEPALPDTGGAIAKALAAGALGPAPFFVVNGDILWLDGPRAALARLAESFDPAKQDGLLLLHRCSQVEGEVERGEFFLDPLGRLRRRGEREVAPFIFAGLQIASPALFEGAASGASDMALAWSRACEAGRLAGLVHDGLWFRLSTPADLAAAESSLHARATGRTR
ncbi:MAG: NTP transferase domain-containing protein [Rhodospirillales bacterium]|nr:NTP transferase domain-containing protein [Rhodospirillales bacterium]